MITLVWPDSEKDGVWFCVLRFKQETPVVGCGLSFTFTTIQLLTISIAHLCVFSRHLGNTCVAILDSMRVLIW